MKYFTQEDKKIDWDKIDIGFIEKLEMAREKSGIPYIITRTYSTPENSVKVGGSNTDSHTEIPCKAADILAKDARSRSLILEGLYFAGFHRIGVNDKNGHIHVDDSTRLDQHVFWVE